MRSAIPNFAGSPRFPLGSCQEASLGFRTVEFKITPSPWPPLLRFWSCQQGNRGRALIDTARYTSVESPLSANASRGRRRELPLSGDRPNRMRLRQFPVHAATVGLRPNASSMKAVRACVSPGVFSHRGRGAVREQCHLPSAGQESLARRISLTHNPSLKRSAIGRPPVPGLLHTVHSHRPGPVVLPLSSA